MKTPVVHRLEGTSCIVYCPDPSADLYIPALIQQQMSQKGYGVVIIEGTPAFATQGEAWAWHVQNMQEAMNLQRQQITETFEQPLNKLKERAGQAIPAKVSLLTSR